MIEWPHYGIRLRLLVEQRDSRGRLDDPHPATAADLAAAGYVPVDAAAEEHCARMELSRELHAHEDEIDRLRKQLARYRDWKLNVEAALRAGYGGLEAKAQADAGLDRYVDAAAADEGMGG